MKKILIIDDELSISAFLSEFLEMKGFEVETASQGEEGLEVFASFDPHLALVDLEMPVMNGFEFCKNILADNPDFPIIIITAHLQKYNSTDIFRLGVKKIITKPLQIRALADTIQNVLTT